MKQDLKKRSSKFSFFINFLLFPSVFNNFIILCSCFFFFFYSLTIFHCAAAFLSFFYSFYFLLHHPIHYFTLTHFNYYSICNYFFTTIFICCVLISFSSTWIHKIYTEREENECTNKNILFFIMIFFHFSSMCFS